MIISHIVAAAKNNTIGVEGELPWNIPEDMKFFRDKTKGRALIMGRKTFESVGHPLPNRLNVVVTRQNGYKAEGAIVVSTIEKALEVCEKQIESYGDEIFIIGGGEIYRQSMNIVNKIYLTRIHKDYKGDAKYPDVDENIFKLIESHDRTEPTPFTFLTYVKK